MSSAAFWHANINRGGKDLKWYWRMGEGLGRLKEVNGVAVTTGLVG